MRLLLILFLSFFFINCSNNQQSSSESNKADIPKQDTIKVAKQIYINGISKGDTVTLNNKEDWSPKDQKTIKAKYASIHSNKRALTEEHLIDTFPNGTKGIVLDYYREVLSDGKSEWRVFKIKVGESEGWIADFDIEK